MKLSFILLSACALLTGCAFNPQAINVSPTVSSTASEAGSGITISLKVVDERASKALGHRGTAYGAAAEITSQQEVSVVVKDQLVAALKKKGFSTNDFAANASPRLTVEVRFLDYSTSTGFWTGGVKIQATLKSVAVNGTETFEKIFRSEKEERVVVVPTAETNEKWINERLSDVLNQLVNDGELISFLSKK